MGLYKRGQVWWIRFTHNGRRIQRSTEVSDKKLAERVHAKLLLEIAEGKWFDNQGMHKTLKDLIEKYEAEHLSKHKNPKRDQSIFKHLKSYFGEDTLLQDIEKTIDGYVKYRTSKTKGKKEKKHLKPNTIRRELCILRAMFNKAKKWRWVKDNPVNYIDMPKANDERVRYLSAEEHANLFKALNNEATPKWLKPIVVMFLNTGLRLSNLLNLKWSQVNLFARTITIEGIHMKNGENLSLPLTQEAFDTLRNLQKTQHIDGYVFHDNGERIYDVKYQRAIRKIFKLADINDFRPAHDFRHTVASYLCQRGIPLHVVSKILGHKDMRMTQRYAHLSVDNLRDAIKVLEKTDCYNFATVNEKGATQNSVTP